MKNLHVRLAQRGAQIEAGKSQMIWHSGAQMKRYDFWREEMFILQFSMEPKAVDMSRMAGAPLLKDHNRSADSTIGVIEKAWLEGGKGYAEFKLSDAPSAADAVLKINEGTLRQVSMEATVEEMEDVTPKKSKIKHYLATRWQPSAVAVVPVGADPGAVMMSDEVFQVVEATDADVEEFALSGAARTQVAGLLLRRRAANY